MSTTRKITRKSIRKNDSQDCQTSTYENIPSFLLPLSLNSFAMAPKQENISTACSECTVRFDVFDLGQKLRFDNGEIFFFSTLDIVEVVELAT